ncbi:hypothetical protein C8A05DRAFT_46784 [Staphylotrichum tortipilum]|uniref:Aminoglycoside phosphotransferase domain-containing protein n=1 Tax=Staphylotrichum tortipilum TaxID=2831512 RepID=A0AAN6RQT0_9PEZI|nr:hypothetical protein C8A05DRAFT_46784 [Staphylotrichum longicolle]
MAGHSSASLGSDALLGADDYGTSISNPVGAPYILMSYIHGTVAAELRSLKSCAPLLFGTPDQDLKFFTGEYYAGPDLQTGLGPWSLPSAYYADLTTHLLTSVAASSHPELTENPLFMLPTILNHLLGVHGEPDSSGLFRLTNCDFGAHNILVGDDFNIVGIFNFDGVMAAPVEAVAQYLTLRFLDTEPLGIFPTKPAVVERVKRTTPNLKEYKELLAQVEREVTAASGNADGGSIGVSIYKGMTAYTQRQDCVNEIWMEACLKMMVEDAKGLVHAR